MHADTQTIKKLILDGNNVYIPLGKVLGLVAVLFASYLWLDRRFQAIDTKFGGINSQLTIIQIKAGDRWTGSDMRLWAEQLKAANPSHVIVPEPVHQSGVANSLKD